MAREESREPRDTVDFVWEAQDPLPPDDGFDAARPEGSGRSRLLVVTVVGVLLAVGLLAVFGVFSGSSNPARAASSGIALSSQTPPATSAGTSLKAAAPTPPESHQSSPAPSPSAASSGIALGPQTAPVTVTSVSTSLKTVATTPPGSHQSSPAPSPSSQPQRVVPAELGAPDFAGYCKATGQGALTQTDKTAYGYHCTQPTSAGLDAEAVCQWTYKTTKVANRVASFADGSTWQCWAANGMLGTLDFDRYCKAKGYTGAVLDPNNNTAYGWSCAGKSSPGAVNTQDACQVLYGSTPPISRFQSYYDPKSWQCWG